MIGAAGPAYWPSRPWTIASSLELDLHRHGVALCWAAGWWSHAPWLDRPFDPERCGQIVPCILSWRFPAVPALGGERLVLIDGYRRVAALHVVLVAFPPASSNGPADPNRSPAWSVGAHAKPSSSPASKRPC